VHGTPNQDLSRGIYHKTYLYFIIRQRCIIDDVMSCVPKHSNRFCISTKTVAHTHVKTMCRDQPVVSQLLRPLLSPFLGKSLSSQSPTTFLGKSLSSQSPTNTTTKLSATICVDIYFIARREVDNAIQSPSHLSHSVSSQYFYISSIVFCDKDISKAINNCQFKFIPPSSTCEIAERSEGCSTQQQDMTYPRHQYLFYLCSGARLLESATQYLT